MFYRHILPNEFDPTTSEFQSCWCHCIKLPYRLRLGKCYRFVTPDESHSVAIVNELEIPEDRYPPFNTPIHQHWRSRPQDFASFAIVILHGKDLPPDAKSSNIDAQSKAFGQEGFSSLHIALRVFNNFLVAYVLAVTKEDHHAAYGCIAAFRPLNVDDFWRPDGGASSLKLVTPVEYELTDRDIEALAIKKSFSVAIPTGRTADLSAASIQQLSGAYLRNEQELFYRFEFEANAALHEGNSMFGLLLACIAFEASYSSLVRSRISLRRGNFSFDVEEIVSEFLRAAGTSKSLWLTIASLMNETERPDEITIANALAALTARNSLMHALRKKGQFKTRNLNDQQCKRHGRALLKLVANFKAAIEFDSM